MKWNYTPPSPLKVARASAGKRQRDLAEEVGRSPAFICRLERGGSALLTPEIAETLSASLGVPAVLLFRNGGGDR